jgi:DNA polymerase-3 subunit epsilon
MSNSLQLSQRVADARAQLAQLEADYIREKSRLDAVQAALFRHLRTYHQKRDRLRLAVEYRQKFLDSFIRDAPDEVEQAEKDFEQAKARLSEDYEELAAAAEKKKLAAGQEAEVTHLWEKLVKLYHPDLFAGEPDNLETSRQLTAAIDLAKANGDIETLREIAKDPHGFVLRQGWATLDFKDAEEPAQLERLHETLQKEIAAVAESLKELRASPDYELCQLAEKRPGALDELAAERARQLELENAELEKQADDLAEKIKKASAAD